MSVFPLFNASFVGLFLVGVFCWKIGLLWWLPVFIIFSILIFLYEIVCSDSISGYVSAFWLFIFSEVVVFGTLLVCCLYFDTFSFINLSSPLEIPFVGCFVLLGSSITVTAFHHLFGWRYSWVFLCFTVLLGFIFVLLQLMELNEVVVNIFDSSFHGSSFCTVGLHFSHVLVGVIGLCVVLSVGCFQVGYYRCTIATWYWHFVDYVWLFVYTLVYVC